MYNIECWKVYTIERKKKIYKEITAILMSGIVISTPLTISGCDSLKEKSNGNIVGSVSKDSFSNDENETVTKYNPNNRYDCYNLVDLFK